MKTYMFCNAHLDPVWLWRWEEGLGETLSTFRTAADLVDEYPDLVFNHNESLLYEWIEEHEPELFERIRRQVEEGRWEIVGGWFLQPDCNIPSGEAIFRQVLRGRLYFYDKFGKVPVTAINMDPFGHAQGLVQMLEKCGFKHYVNIRPGKDNYDFPDEDFIWRGYEGSEVIVHRSDKGYNSVLGKAAEELATWTEERNFYMDWCKRVVFEAELPPSSMSRFDVHFEIIERRSEPELAADRRGKITIPTERGQVVVNANTGLVDSYVVDGREYLKPGALSVDVYNDSFNSWGGQPFLDFAMPIGRFTPMTAGQATDFAGVKDGIVPAVRVTDEGDVQVVVEADMKYNDSKLLMRYIVNKQSGTLETETRIFFAEKEKRVKLNIPTTLEGGEYIGQTIFGRERLDVRDGEYVSQYWQTIVDGDSALAVIDDGVYGSSCRKGCAGMTLLRSAGYGAARSAWGEPFHEPMYQQRMEQGERRYRFMLVAGESEKILREVDREAAAFNQKPYALPYCPSGRGEIPKPLISIDRENVALSCFKRSERDPRAYILRVFECQGTPTDVKIYLPALGIVHETKLGKFEIKTFVIRDGRISETDILEGAIAEIGQR